MRLAAKFIKFGTASDEVNARSIPANYTPSSYTPVAAGTEGTDKVSSHLKGINTALSAIVSSAGDLAEASFTAADNQSSAANVTGLAFANGTVRSFDATVSIVRGATYAQYKLHGIQKGSSWDMDKSYVGDVAGITFTITTAGQVQYTSTSTGSTATIKYRATTTSV